MMTDFLRHAAPGSTADVIDVNGRKYVIVIERSETGCAAYFPDVPGCTSAGNTIDETLENAREALAAHLGC